MKAVIGGLGNGALIAGGIALAPPGSEYTILALVVIAYAFGMGMMFWIVEDS